MTAFTIQASKNGQTITTVRIRPTVCVEKAKTLLQKGWQVHITNGAGHQYGSDEFDQLAADQSNHSARSRIALSTDPK
jgi:carbamate kinase